MNVREIVEKWLKENKFNGLWNDLSECGCEIGYLMPCSNEGIDGCEAGYKVDCTTECDHEGAEEGGWHIQPDPPKEGG